ncbi:uncharacterized protein Bfra_003847 [Botrytis fragariae]|uniref:Uncharacterized protein n=1 Tax=Botrytis fragariae TaxID=1964551 RepID=A0A8H6AX29_9HELO|nr:uncharacterized protein Bfra_003847 [Botrytis fragariae]KAF5875393.1 hypothetical protein Bfra_003847 [Botrytis fragariae]
MSSSNDAKSASAPQKDETPSNLLNDPSHKPKGALPKLNDNTDPGTPDENQSLAQRIHHLLAEKQSTVGKISHLKLRIDGFELEGGNQ